TERKSDTKRVAIGDPHTQSNASVIHPGHLQLDIRVNFDSRRIEGCASWTLDPDSGVHAALFDTYDLLIDSVQYADGSAAPFRLGQKDSILGSALSVELRPGTKRLNIYYRTGPNPTALQWLEPG